MAKTAAGGRWVVVAVAALAAVPVVWTSTAVAERNSRFAEETAVASWAVPYRCAEGRTVRATLVVRTARTFVSPETEDPDATAQVRFLAVCPDGSSVGWAAPTAAAVVTSTNDLTSVTAAGAGTARDDLGSARQVSFGVAWTGVGPTETTADGPGTATTRRAATATGLVTVDGVVLVDGGANHPTGPAPFIRVET